MQKYSKKPETRKAFNYDLYSKKVEMFYTGTTTAWNDIKTFFIDRGFEDRQYSGVISIRPMTAPKATALIKALNKKYPWLKKCIRRFDMTSIEKEFDMSKFFKNNKEHTNVKISNSKKTVSNNKFKENTANRKPLNLKKYQDKANEHNKKLKKDVASLDKKTQNKKINRKPGFDDPGDR